MTYKTPRFAYTVKVVHPQCIQLGHPDPVPFTIYLLPALEDGKTTLYPDGDLSHLPAVKGVALRMKLESNNTRLRVKRNGADYDQALEALGLQH